MLKDEILEERQNQFRKTKMDILQKRETWNLSLRKKKLDDLIFQKRLRKNNYAEEITTNINPSINPFFLKADLNLKNIKIENLNSDEDLNFIFQIITSNSSLDNIKYVIFIIREYLSSDSITSLNYIRLVQRGLINVCKYYLSIDEELDIIFEIYWILTNLLYLGNIEISVELTEPTYLSIYTKHLENCSYEILNQILWMLNNACAEGNKISERLLSSPSNIFSALVNKFIAVIKNTQNRKCLVKSFNALFFTIVKHKPESDDYLDKYCNLIPIFSEMMIFQDNDIFFNSITGLQLISDMKDTQRIIPNLILFNNGNFLNMLMREDLEQNKEFILPIVRIIGNCLVAEDKVIDEILNLGVLNFFDKILIIEKNKLIKREVIWAISNITGGNYYQMKQVIESNVFHHLFLATDDYDFNVKREALIALMNICLSSQVYLVTTLINKGIFNVLISIIESRGNHDLVDMALTSVECLLRSGEALKKVNGINSISRKFSSSGGVAALESLQSHSNHTIYKKGMNLISEFFDGGKSEQEDFTIYNEFIDFSNKNKFSTSENNFNQFIIKSDNSSQVKYNYNGPNGLDDFSFYDKNSTITIREYDKNTLPNPFDCFIHYCNK